MSSRIRSEFGTLGERAAAQRPPESLPRHVWVDAGEAGLLLQWRRGARGWDGLVCRLGASGEPVAEWLPADRLAAA